MSAHDILAAPVEHTIRSVAIQYALFEVLALTATLTVMALHLRQNGEVILSRPKDITFGKLILAGPREELLYRGLPLVLAGYLGFDALPVLFVGTMVWATMHAEVQSVHAAVAGIFYIKLWLTGLGLVAIVIHSAHNAVLGFLTGTDNETPLGDGWAGEVYETPNRYIAVIKEFK